MTTNKILSGQKAPDGFSHQCCVQGEQDIIIRFCYSVTNKILSGLQAPQKAPSQLLPPAAHIFAKFYKPNIHSISRL